VNNGEYKTKKNYRQLTLSTVTMCDLLLVAPGATSRLS
jgi:hypothetical protein